MNSGRLIHRVYDTVHIILWTALGAVAVLIGVAMITEAPRYRAEAQRRLIEEIFAENQRYCTKWGFALGTHEYNLCELDLAEIRTNEDERAAPVWP